MHFVCVNNAAGTMEGFCLLKHAEIKTGSKGGPYLDLTLTDKDGEMNAKLWDYALDRHGEFLAGQVVKVRGIITPYNGVDQFRVERMRAVDARDEYSIEDLVPCAPQPGQVYFDEIWAVTERFANEPLRQTVQAALREREPELLFWPAAFRLHHAVRGGLLWHTCSILRMAQSVVALYSQLNADLLFAGVILHDIEKLSEFEVSQAGLASGYTLRGNLVGHLAGGAAYVERLGQQFGMDEERLLLLQHMLISHHGEPEFGAAMRPGFLEAEVLAELDLLDARINEVSAALDTVPAGTYTNRLWALENRKFYKPHF